MGGAIGFTLREEDGKEHRMCRWTNAMPWAITNMGIVNKDPIHIHDVLGNWYEMVEDYNAGREQKSPMAWCYVPYAGLNPVEYGLIVVDMQKNVILSMNHYTAVGGMSVVCLKNEMRAVAITDSATVLTSDPHAKRMGRKAFKRRKPNDDNDAVRFMEFVYDGRVREVEYYDKLTDSVHRKPVELKTVDDVVAYIKPREHDYDHFVCDMSPFEVRTLDKTLEGCKELYQAVKDLGFILTEKEEEAWVNYMGRWNDEPGEE